MKVLLTVFILLVGSTLFAQLPVTLEDFIAWQMQKTTPEVPKAVGPSAGDVNVPVDKPFTWRSLGGESCDVWLSTSSALPTLPTVAAVPCGSYAAKLLPGTKYWVRYRARNGAGTATGTTFTFTTAATLPPPVDCVPSAWSPWIATGDGSWSSCVGDLQSRPEQRARTVLTPASSGGSTAACIPLSETRTTTQACTVTPPPPPPPINCVGTWSACLGGVETFTVTTPSANGGAACPASPRSCTITLPSELCGDGIDNDKDGQIDEGCPTGNSPLARNEHPRLGMTLADRQTIKARVASGGEWHGEFQTYVNYITNTAQWNSTTTNQYALAQWAAAAGFVYQMFAGGAPTGISFPATADTQAEWAAKGIDWLLRVHAVDGGGGLAIASITEHFFAYDWLHPAHTPHRRIRTRRSVVRW